MQNSIPVFIGVWEERIAGLTFGVGAGTAGGQWTVELDIDKGTDKTNTGVGGSQKVLQVQKEALKLVLI